MAAINEEMIGPSKNITALDKNCQQLSERLNAQILSSQDYRMISQLAYMLWRIDKPSTHDDAIQSILDSDQFYHFIATSLNKPALRGVFTLLENPELETENGARETLRQFFQHPDIACQLPEAWIDTGAVVDQGRNFQNAFPMSAQNFHKSPDWLDSDEGYNATRDDNGRIISACGPTGGTEGGGDLADWSTLMLEQQPWCVVALGSAASYQKYWLEPGREYAGYKITLEKSGHTQLRFTAPSRQSVTTDFVNVKIPDRHAMHFTYETAQQFIRINEFTTAGKPILIHCASGVGRTGFFKWLMVLEKAMKINPMLAELMDSIFARLLTDDEQQALTDIIKQELFTLRKTRFTVQTDIQVKALMPALLQLRVIQLGKSQEYFEQTSSALEIPVAKASEFSYSLPVDYTPAHIHVDAAEESGAAAASAFSAAIAALGSPVHAGSEHDSRESMCHTP